MKLNLTSFPADNPKAPRVPDRVKIIGEHFDSPQAQEQYIKDVAANNSRFEQWDSNYDFVKGFRGKGSELGFIGGACAGGAFTAYKIVESLVRTPETLGPLRFPNGNLIGPLVLGTALTMAGFWASGAAGAATGYGVGWAIDKSSQALGAPEVWFKNGQ